MEDSFTSQLDVVAINKYMGWYHPWPVEPKDAIWEVVTDKPLIISEFGGEALYGQSGDENVVSSWSEEYQARLYRDNIRMFDNIPNLRGVSPWILFDFRSPFRFHPTNQDGWNRKFFDVSKNKIPFVIKMSNGLRLKVHGTSFNLQAYTDEKTVEASLVEGCIELDHGNDKLLMNAGDMAIFDKQTNKMRPISGVLSHSYSWLEDKLYMDHMSLASVCKYLERRYDVTIHLQKDLGNSIHYDGVIQEETITDILGVLSRLSDISYNVKGKNISITSK